MAVRSKSSKAWLHEHVNDHYVHMAQKEGYRARAAYKLLEINEKDKDVTFEKLVEKHYLDGPADKASTAPNGKKIVIANGKATLQK